LTVQAQVLVQEQAQQKKLGMVGALGLVKQLG
jgi:hypothetical protein